MTDHPNPTPPQPALDPATALRQLIMGFRSTQLVRTAAELGLADHLADSPKTAADLAPLLNVDPTALHRFMRALASLGLLAEVGGRAYAATALLDCMRTGGAGSMRSLARIYGADWVWRAYAQLPWSVATGKAGFDAAHGQPLFAFLNEHADASGMFHEAMAAFSEQEVTAILGAYDFAYAACVVDVGGGNGALLAAIAMAYPRLSGILFDQVATAELGALRARRSGRGGSRYGLPRRLLSERATRWGPLPPEECDPRLGRLGRSPNPEDLPGRDGGYSAPSCHRARRTRGP